MDILGKRINKGIIVAMGVATLTGCPSQHAQRHNMVVTGQVKNPEQVVDYDFGEPVVHRARHKSKAPKKQTAKIKTPTPKITARRESVLPANLPVKTLAVAMPSKSQPVSVPQETFIKAEFSEGLTETYETMTEAPRRNLDPNVWTDIRAGMALPKRLRDPAVKKWIRWFAKHPEYIERVFNRSKPYMYYIKEEIRRNKLPTEIALLPVVESGFDPFAYSHSNAAGLWQFVPVTANRFNMDRNWWVDERRDLMESTQSAIKYLKYLNKHFKGDWLHALAAYNAGEGTVGRAIRKNRRNGRGTSFWDLPLPKETRGYVPKLMALTEIVRNPKKYGVKLPDVRNELAFLKVDLPAQIDLAVAAEMAEISVEELQKYNAAYNRWATAPEGPHRLLVPLNNVIEFEAALKTKKVADLVRMRSYKIVGGDTLARIARANGVTISMLRKANGFEPGERLKIGKRLMIPQAADGQKGQATGSVARRLAKAVNKGKRGFKRHIYNVRSGDTLWDIARVFKVKVRDIARWNKMSSKASLRDGKRLIIWEKISSSSSLDKQYKDDPMIQKVSYKVRRGDSLSTISDKFNISVADIRDWNRIESRYIKTGQNIRMFIDVRQQF